MLSGRFSNRSGGSGRTSARERELRMLARSENAPSKILDWTPPDNSKTPNYSPLEQEDGDNIRPQTPKVPVLGDRRQELAYAATTIGITMRAAGSCKVEDSVYDAAIVMPQLARTVGWNKTFSMFAIRSFLFLLLNGFLQAYLLKAISKEQTIMDRFAEQMYLCDFGAAMESCPGPGCRGPGGTDVTPRRLYDWEAIVNRNFVKNSLKALFPDKVAEIDEHVDPGEYGVESNPCRYICCFIFTVACLDELVRIWQMLQLHYRIPHKAEPWIEPRATASFPPTGEIEEVRVMIAGMPLLWKLINLSVVILPRFMLWELTVDTGITFLMETSQIDDLIVNSVALSFILNIDELIMMALMNQDEINLVSATEEFALYDPKTSCVGDMSILKEDEIIERYKKEEYGGFCSLGLKDFSLLIPFKLLISLLGSCFFVFQYYRKNCVPDDQEGAYHLVSKPMHAPKSISFDWLNAFLPAFFHIELEDEPYWEMPKS